MAVLDPSIFLDGFAAVPIASIAKIKPAEMAQGFVERALHLHGE